VGEWCAARFLQSKHEEKTEEPKPGGTTRAPAPVAAPKPAAAAPAEAPKG
jgi:hypothetical protein